MKINSPSSAFTPFDRIRDSESANDAPNKREREKRDPGQKDKKDDPREYEEVNAAVGAFAQEKSVAENGLQAEVAGQGPGLKVTLKDGQGAVVRQLTGEEFLRLREAASGVVRGRLLDKKL